MKIQIDNREHKRIEEILKYYENIDDCECSVETLPVGDIIFEEEIVFEWKTIPDFIESIKDHRVFNQSIDMYNKFLYHYVIIVGDDLKKYLKIHGMTLNHYWGAINQLFTYTRVIHVHNNSTAYCVMLNIARKCLSSKLVYKQLPMKTPNPAQNLLLLGKHIGDETVKLMEQELDIYSWNDLKQLEYKDLIKIKGIGPKTANLIINYIGEVII